MITKYRREAAEQAKTAQDLRGWCAGLPGGKDRGCLKDIPPGHPVPKMCGRVTISFAGSFPKGHIG